MKHFTQLAPVYTSVAPNSAAQGTAVSPSGRTQAFIGLDVATDANTGSPPREAPV